jgi:HSP20 family protein
MGLPILRNATSNVPVRYDNAGPVRETALSTWNPWREIEQVDRWFDDFMARSFGAFGLATFRSPWGSQRPDGMASAPAPAIDLYETPDEVILFAYCPGARRDAFDLSVTGTDITLKGERQPLMTASEKENWTGYGPGFARMQGAFEATYSLPCEVTAEKARADYRDGVLEVHLPKAENAKVRTVKVNVQGE